MRWAFVFLLLCPAARAATYPAATAARADVVTAYNLTSDGDTVTVPAGSANWTTGIVITRNVHFIASGTNATIITGKNLFDYTTANTANSPEISYFQFGDGSGAGTSVIAISGASTNVNIHHNYFKDCAIELVVFSEDTSGAGGVLHHNFVNLNAGGYRFVMAHSPAMFGGTWGDKSWENAVVFGRRDGIYVEDNWIEKNTGTAYSAFDGWSGGRLVVRHNVMIGVRVSNHGTETSQRKRGGRLMEVYKNLFTNNLGTLEAGIETRSGTMIACSNLFFGAYQNAMKFEAYRFTLYPPWGSYDGTKAWDTPDLTDGAGSPGGAGDGVFDGGTASAAGANSLTDSTKSWTVNQWANYMLREEIPFTAASGGVRSAVVTGAGWSTDQWAGWEFTKTSDNSKGAVLSNNGTTLTLDSTYYAVDMTGGGAFVLSKASIIIANTPTVLTTSASANFVNENFIVGAYTIRRVSAVLDDPGRGATTAFSSSPPNHQNLSQPFQPIFEWENYIDGAPATVLSPYVNIISGRNWSNAPYASWVPYTYPHDLQSGGGGGSPSVAAPAALGILGINLRSP